MRGLATSLAHLHQLAHSELGSVRRYLSRLPKWSAWRSLDDLTVVQTFDLVASESTAPVRRLYHWAEQQLSDEACAIEPNGQECEVCGKETQLVKRIESAARAIFASSAAGVYRLWAAALFSGERVLGVDFSGGRLLGRAKFHTDLGHSRMEVLTTLLDKLRQQRGAAEPLRMAEIGVARAATPDYVLRRDPALQWLGIDPYEHDPYEHKSGNAAFKRAWSKLAPLVSGNRTRLLRKRSDEVTDSEVPRQSLDLLFIDGDHSEAQVRRDLELWAPRVRQGGIIAGHDYLAEHSTGVTPAVHNFVPEGVELGVAPDHVFFWYVPERS